MCRSIYCPGQRTRDSSQDPINITWNINANLYNYWRIGTRSGGSNESFWDEMLQENVVSLGWEKLGDLSWLGYNQESKR